MKVEYKRDMDITYLIIETEGVYKEDYQMKMMERNRIQGLLMVRGSGVDDNSQYSYDISGKISMRALYEKTNLHYKDMKQFMIQLVDTIKIIRRYMLEAKCLILEPEYIFYEEGRYFFCYYPMRDIDLYEAFHKLTEYFVSRTDYSDQQGIFMAYELHKATMEENYSIGQIVERIISAESEQEGIKTIEEPEPEIEEPEEELFLQPEMGIKMAKASRLSGNILKRISKRRKASKWGNWDELPYENEIR